MYFTAFYNPKLSQFLLCRKKKERKEKKKERKQDYYLRMRIKEVLCILNPYMIQEISGEITPERMKGRSQSKNNTQLWM